MASLSIFSKPEDTVVFIDSSALVEILDVRSKSAKKREIGEAYSKLFSEFLPKWEIIGIINPLVLLEMTNAIERMALEEHSGVPSRDVREIKKEMAKSPNYYQPHWEKAHGKAMEWFQLIVETLKVGENILCRRFPKEDSDYSMSRDVLRILNDVGPRGPTPADIFHYQFMKRNKLRIAIAYDKHFGMIPGVMLHTFQ